ncbi:MAG: hypothetical protein HC845_01255 [Akkermansiaceae bacterium]|nr:hypothetical protein [Akkermansiaceae bacterium]
MKPRFIIAITTACLLASCATSTPKGSAQQSLARPIEERIRWPERYQPDKSTFFVHNEIEIKAPADVVWRILIDAESWPQWYEGAENVKLTHSTTGNWQSIPPSHGRPWA